MTKPCSGLSLIEVMVALVILSIAMLALLQLMANQARNLSYLSQKQAASWVALDRLNQVALGLIRMDADQTHQTGHAEWLNHRLTWTLSLESTPNPRIGKIRVTVTPYHQPEQPLLTWVDFLSLSA